MGGPQITTIIPTYSRPKMLRRSIKSVLAQTYPHFQVMVLDNASGDETPQVVAELARQDSRVKCHCHPDNIGAFANFDYGLRHVETPFFSFLSDDDVVLPHFYEIALKGFEQHPDAMFSAGQTIVTYPHHPIGPIQMPTCRPGRYDPPESVFELTAGMPNWTAILFRAEVLDEVGYLAPNVLSADTEFELRIALRFPFVVNPRVCAFRLNHPGSPSATKDVDYFWPNMWNMIHNLTEDERLEAPLRERLRAVMTRRLIGLLTGISLHAIRIGEFDEADKARAILQKHFGLRRTSRLLRMFAAIMRSTPPAAWLVNALSGVRRFYYRRRAARRMTPSDWARLKEANRYLELIDHWEKNGENRWVAGKTR